MYQVYERTSLTQKDVARSSGYIDWNSQPSIFKHYPEFLFHYAYGEKIELRIIELSRIITSSQMIASKPYYKLNTPSAGNLHPVELYVQIRAIKGIISGIYHVDVSQSRIVLIQEIDEDGIETALGLFRKFNGILFFVTTVPYRSEWKYGERAARYCYLDVGHQIASIEAAATLLGQETTILSGYDVKELNKTLGMTNEEFVCGVIGVGTKSMKPVKKLHKNLIRVSPTDYCDSSEYVHEVIMNENVFQSLIFPFTCKLSEDAILERRSARKFVEAGLDKERLESIVELLDEPRYPLNCYMVVLNDTHQAAGIYLNKKLLQQGVFTDTMITLLVDQQFIKNATVVIVMTSKYFSSGKLIQAGALSHKLYLQTYMKGIPMSSIGAFYDKPLQQFLDMQEYILCVCVV